ncbi:hypothetical protein ILYODFUR_021371 [Ilyodon furcidens]|uniref:Uncharacterized protein n=1 Tax=Ilyodon furcidens TaxID=33524 RepID=A0ABV0UJH0_9TELE
MFFGFKGLVECSWRLDVDFSRFFSSICDVYIQLDIVSGEEFSEVQSELCVLLLLKNAYVDTKFWFAPPVLLHCCCLKNNNVPKKESSDSWEPLLFWCHFLVSHKH